MAEGQLLTGGGVKVKGFVPGASLLIFFGQSAAKDLDVLPVDDIAVKVVQRIADPAGGTLGIGNIFTENHRETAGVSFF